MSINVATQTRISPIIENLHQRAQQYDYLCRDVEHTLIHQAQTQPQSKAKDRLVQEHIRYITKLATQYRGYQLNDDDLIQEGVCGLLEAIQKFDLNSGHRLNTFARHYILSAMNEFVVRNVDIVKIATTKAQRKLFFNLRKLKKGGTLTIELAEQIAQQLDVSIGDVWQMEMRMNAYNVSFDVTQTDDEEYTFDAQDYLFNEHDDAESILINTTSTIHNNLRLQQAMDMLDERKQDIIQRRWLDEQKTPLRALAEKYSISLERVRQLEKQAFETLKAQIGVIH